jgi:hypothetical protein
MIIFLLVHFSCDIFSIPTNVSEFGNESVARTGNQCGWCKNHQVKFFQTDYMQHNIPKIGFNSRTLPISNLNQNKKKPFKTNIKKYA